MGRLHFRHKCRYLVPLTEIGPYKLSLERSDRSSCERSGFMMMAVSTAMNSTLAKIDLADLELIQLRLTLTMVRQPLSLALKFKRYSFRTRPPGTPVSNPASMNTLPVQDRCAKHWGTPLGCGRYSRSSKGAHIDRNNVSTGSSWRFIA
jgi:hypothetical protein